MMAMVADRARNYQQGQFFARSHRAYATPTSKDIRQALEAVDREIAWTNTLRNANHSRAGQGALIEGLLWKRRNLAVALTQAILKERRGMTWTVKSV